MAPTRYHRQETRERPSRQGCLRRTRRGFTFVEILAAMLFMAIVIPVAIQGMMSANRMGVVASRKRFATQLADQQLTDMVLTGQWQTGNQSGDFGEDFPGFTWELLSEDWSEDVMGMVSMVVTFKVQERDYEVVLTTLVDTAALTEESTTETGTTSQSGTTGGTGT